MGPLIYRFYKGKCKKYFGKKVFWPKIIPGVRKNHQKKDFELLGGPYDPLEKFGEGVPKTVVLAPQIQSLVVKTQIATSGTNNAITLTNFGISEFKSLIA